MTHLGLLVSKLSTNYESKQKREGRVFSFLRLVLGLRKAVSLENFVFKNCGCNIWSERAQNPLTNYFKSAFPNAPNSFANSSNPRPNGSKFGGGVGMKTVVLSLWVLFFLFFCFLGFNCGLWCFFVFVVSRVCHCVWWVMHVFMSPGPYARLALKAGEFIEHCGGTYHT